MLLTTPDFGQQHNLRSKQNLDLEQSHLQANPLPKLG